ncbi:glycosyltransferase family 4 protein [Phytohabitans sp. ZYX-F-186]|uniref:Glycosyltransferase family 4 protein n=1 Tax=Phytohabitans maris TaxID=3071409 RepID=A0ABU0ZTX0_9ACTN|nr:glycosyltransferase family 4 protein [Phytohabitans sp. ZYX-F-186]MDQ7909620.1 glycosyltransferase family 4 protein [Phytohabitans sp. ZYX-F-186]
MTADPSRPSRRARPRHVTILIANLPAERDRRVIRECLTLEENGYEVTVIAPRGNPDLRVLPGSRNTRLKPYPVYLNGSGVLTFAAEFVWSFLCVAVRLLGEVLHGRAHAVQVCNPPDVYWPLALFIRALGRPWVFDHHDLSPEVYATRSDGAPNPLVFRALTAMEWLTLRTASAVVATNESFRENALRRGVPPESVTVVRNGPSAREIAPAGPAAAPDGTHRIVYLGVLGKQDNVAAVVYAAQELARRRPAQDWRVVVAGDGETLDELKELAVARGVADRVEFTGWLGGDEVDALLQTATVGVQPDLPTRMNHLSTMAKSVEYVSRGVPVVAVDLVETRRTAGDAAVYVETGSPAEFAVAIDMLLDDPERRAAMGKVALDRFATELSWEHQSVRYAAMWHRLFRGSRGRGQRQSVADAIPNPRRSSAPRHAAADAEPVLSGPESTP